MSGDLSYEWSWEQLLAENVELLDKAWATLLKSPEKAEEIPQEHRVSVLTTGYNLWVTPNHLTTTRGTVLFKQLLNVNMVSSSFQYYRDCFLFALSVAWDVDVQRFDLAPEQSQAAFSYVDIMKHATKISPQRGARGRWDRQAQMAENAGDAGASMGQPNQHVRQDGGAGGDPAHSVLEGEMKYALTKHNLKLLRKRAGVTRWTQNCVLYSKDTSGPCRTLKRQE